MKHLAVSPKSLQRLALTGLLFAAAASPLYAADSIVWHADTQTIDMDIDNKPLATVAADFEKATGRPIVIPPGVSKTVSLKFAGKTMGEGVSKILDGLNYHTDGTGAEAKIIVIDPSGTTTVAVRPMVSAPRAGAPVNTVYTPPGKDGRGGPGGTKGGGGPGGTGGTGGTGGGRGDGRTDRLTEAIMREATGGGGGTRGSGGGGDTKRSSPSRPPR